MLRKPVVNAVLRTGVFRQHQSHAGHVLKTYSSALTCFAARYASSSSSPSLSPSRLTSSRHSVAASDVQCADEIKTDTPPAWLRWRVAVTASLTSFTSKGETSHHDMTEISKEDLAGTWQQTYGALFTQSVIEDADAAVSALFPSSSADLLTLLQALVDGLRVVHHIDANTKKEGREEEHEADCRRLEDEMQAVALLLLHARLGPLMEAARLDWTQTPTEPLERNSSVSERDAQTAPSNTVRYSMPTTTKTTRRRKLTHYSTREDNDEDIEYEATEEDKDADERTVPVQRVSATGTDTLSASSSSAAASTSLTTASARARELGTLGFRRTASETVAEMSARTQITTAQQLQWVMLVDTLLLAATSLTLTRAAQHALYCAALVVLEVAERLPSAAVAALVECMARCAQGSVLTQQLEHLRVERRDSVVRRAVDSMDPCPFRRFTEVALDDVPHTRTPTAAAAANLTDLPLPPRAEPGLSLVEQEERDEFEHWEAGLHSAIKPVTLIGHVDVVARLLRHRMASTITAVDSSNDDDDDDTVNRADAMTGLLSLAQKKAKNAAEKRAKERIRAVVVADAERPTAETSSDWRDTTAITLLDVAQVATGLASLRYMDAALWKDVTAFTTWSIRMTTRFAKERKATPAVGQEELHEDEAAASEHQLLQEVRDVCFALDFVQQPGLYDSVMQALVRDGHLTAPIPPPSQMMRGMSSTSKIHSPQEGA